MITEAHLALLEELGVRGKPHSGRSLLEHLRGTFDLLSAWGNPQNICLAGLFHSIYGTYAYRIQSAGFESRERLRAAIGERSEELVYLFGVTNRPAFWDQIGNESIVVHDITRDEKVAVSSDTLRALLEMDVANYVEMMPAAPPPTDELRTFKKNVEAARSFLTVGAYRAALERLTIAVG